jgi:lipid-A-disaccharide synthase
VRGRFLAAKPDVFVGIDAPEFNLRLARNLRAAGIPTVQYVSPQVWAWRQSRVRSIHESVDLVLCLLPFEKRFYDEQQRHARGIRRASAGGCHSRSRWIAAGARGLGLRRARPGRGAVAGQPARRGHAARSGFRAHGAVAGAHAPGAQFIAPMASAGTRELFAAALERNAPGST